MTDIRVIMFQDGPEFWVAQGLEHDICVQAPSMKDLYGRFDVAVMLESAEEGGLERIPPAPQHFFDLWDSKAGSFAPEGDGNSHYQYGIAA